ncbi:MAG: 7,8-didemethyl-8-hydroxy-5-deazariboflavin synthase subunit CofH [Halobacteria archaeon]
MVEVQRRGSEFGFELLPGESKSNFENALEKARSGERLSVDDATELLTTGTDTDGIVRERKNLVLEAADRRRREVVGDEVTFVANLNNNVTTACNVGCLFCNFKDAARKFRVGNEDKNDGFTKTPRESRDIARDARDLGVYEICSVSGLHPTFVLDDEHREILESMSEGVDGNGNHGDRAESSAGGESAVEGKLSLDVVDGGPEEPSPGSGGLNYLPESEFESSPGSYVDQVKAMSDPGLHVHSMTPEEAYHASRGVDWSYREVYSRLKDAGLDSVPGTAAEILVEEVREVLCPGKIGADEWMEAMVAATEVGLDVTATVMYGHIENARHRALHLERIRELQDRTGAVTEFVPLTFIHENTPLYGKGMVDGGASKSEDELMVAVSRLFLDNIENIQSSWVKYGDELGLRMLNCGANDFMGTILSEEITRRAGGEHGEYRSFGKYVEMIESIDRIPVERTTDYREKRVIDVSEPPYGPNLGPGSDGSPMI